MRELWSFLFFVQFECVCILITECTSFKVLWSLRWLTFLCRALFRSCFSKSRASTISFCASDNLTLPDSNMLSSSCLVAIPVNQWLTLKTVVVIHSTKMTGNFSLKLNWFGQTGKVSKKVVHLERLTSFLGWTGPGDRSINRCQSRTLLFGIFHVQHKWR